MPVPDQGRDDESGIQRQAWIPALRYASAGMTIKVARLIIQDLFGPVLKPELHEDWTFPSRLMK